MPLGRVGGRPLYIFIQIFSQISANIILSESLRISAASRRRAQFLKIFACRRLRICDRFHGPDHTMHDQVMNSTVMLCSEPIGVNDQQLLVVNHETI